MGHRAALIDKEEWIGIWQLEFWSDTEQGTQEAQRVAAATRTVQAQVPEIIDLKVTPEGALNGYLRVPNADQAVVTYNHIDVYVSILDEDGQSFYKTRSQNTGYLAATPLRLGDDNQFSVPRIGNILFDWDDDYAQRALIDSCEVIGGGKMYAHLRAGGRVLITMVLERDFPYGPPGNILAWTTPNSSLDVSEHLLEVFQPRDDTLSSGAIKCLQRQTLVKWLNDHQGDPLPDSVTLEVTNTAPGSSVEDPALFDYEVIVSGGLLPWNAAIEVLQVGAAIDGEPLTTDAATAEYNKNSDKDWICTSNPTAAEYPERLDAFELSIHCDLGELVVTQSANITTELEITVAANVGEQLNDYLVEIEWDLAPPEAQERLANLISSNRRLTAKPEIVTVAFPAPPQQYRDSILLWLLIPLFLLALCLRFVRQFWMRL